MGGTYAGRILLVNDDGIDAPGMAILERVAHSLSDDVWVVAPDEERSGASHSISITVPVRLRKVGERRFAVKGTPTDCVLLALYDVMKDAPPSLVLSGINRGANLAEDATYSGTTMAAMEGTLLGIPSIALSQVFPLDGKVPWETAERFAPIVLRALLGTTWGAGTFINVNFPDAAAADVREIRVTSQGARPPGAFRPERRIDGRRMPYYWICLTYPPGNELPGTDLEAIKEKAISITPLQIDMSSRREAERLRETFKELDLGPS